MCCGTYGFKPTASRVPYGKQAPLGNPGIRNILASAGPLANDFDALAIFMKAVLDTRPARLDSTVLDVPWVPVGKTKPRLRFGVLAEDPLFPVHPPVRKAVADAANLLKRKGHEIVTLTPEECVLAVSWDAAMQTFSLDRTSFETVVRGGEPFIPSIVAIRDSMRGINFDRDRLPDTRVIEGGLERLAILNVERSRIQEAWREIFLQHQLDAVIGPGASNTAIEHDQFGPAPYTGFVNFLDVCLFCLTLALTPLIY